jgi:dihydrofolate reductase
MIGMIAAVTQNGVIGIENQIPFDYPEDLKHFKNKTLNSTVIMGRKTFEGIGRPLPKRNNIVVSSKKLEIQGISVAPSLDEAILMAPTDRDIWLCGGAKIYEDGMNFADKIVLTITPDVELREPAVRFPWINPLKFEIKLVIELDSGSKCKVVTYTKI